MLQALKLLSLSLMIYTWRRLPVVGKLASPVVGPEILSPTIM